MFPVLLASAALAGVSDLRTEVLLDGISAEEKAAGAALLETVLDAHGGADVWASATAASVEFDDVFSKGILAKLATPMPDNGAVCRVDFEPGSGFITEHTYEDGTRVGIYGTATYTVEDGERDYYKNKNHAFYLKAVQYFAELPFRLQEADVIAAAGSATFKGREYDLLFVTWGDGSPSKEVDQYVLYVDPQTGLLARTDFTIREFRASLVTSAFLSEYDTSARILVPGFWQVGEAKGDEIVKPLHDMRFRNLTYTIPEPPPPPPVEEPEVEAEAPAAEEPAGEEAAD